MIVGKKYGVFMDAFKKKVSPPGGRVWRAYTIEHPVRSVLQTCESRWRDWKCVR